MIALYKNEYIISHVIGEKKDSGKEKYGTRVEEIY